jgi:hypothetical protein
MDPSGSGSASLSLGPLRARPSGRLLFEEECAAREAREKAVRFDSSMAGTCTGDGGASSAAAGVRGAVRFHRVKFCEPRDSAFSRGGRLLARRPSAQCRLLVALP